MGTSSATGTGFKRILATPRLILFIAGFLVFPVCAGFMAHKTGTMLVDRLRAKHWVETPATIQTTSRESQRRRNGTAYEVTATYTFRFNGRDYTGHRVGLGSGSDHIDSWHENTFNRLRAAQKDGRPVPCFVNPEHPEEAVLDRDLRYPLIVFSTLLVLGFGGVGLGFYGGLVSWLIAKRRPTNTRPNPEEPWAANPYWTAGVIPSSLRQRAAIALVAAAFWTFVSAPAVLLVPSTLRHGWDPSTIGGMIFAAIGLGIIIWAYRCVSRLKRFGGSRFELDTIPGVIGGQLRGRLILVGDVAAIDQVQTRLVCVWTRYSGSPHGSTQKYTIWEDAQILQATDVTFGQSEVTFPVEFRIPGNCPQTDEFALKSPVNWQLLVAAQTPGVNLKLQFSVPVFRTKDSPAPV